MFNVSERGVGDFPTLRNSARRRVYGIERSIVYVRQTYIWRNGVEKLVRSRGCRRGRNIDCWNTVFIQDWTATAVNKFARTFERERARRVFCDKEKEMETKLMENTSKPV